jgi:hypothetical protein
MAIDRQKYAHERTDRSNHLPPGNLYPIDEIIDSQYEDGPRGVKSVNHIDRQIEEALCKDKAIENKQKMTNRHCLD